jgi:hypothetical protein
MSLNTPAAPKKLEPHDTNASDRMTLALMSSQLTGMFWKTPLEQSKFQHDLSLLSASSFSYIFHDGCSVNHRSMVTLPLSLTSLMQGSEI